MQNIRTLVRMVHGSHLYGTATKSSDHDYKGVHLPSGHAILLGRPEDVITRNSRPATRDKNNAGDIDEQSYSLAKFLKMVSVGDTVATEMLFVPDDAIIETSPEWEEIRALSGRLISRECRGFVRYCMQQAAKYSIKGERLAACERVIALLQEGLSKHGSQARLAAMRSDLDAFLGETNFAGIIPLDSPHGSVIDHFVCLDRKMPVTARISDALGLYRRIQSEYGRRAAAARSAGGVDWKAMSHALRVARQAGELLSTGSLTLPRPDAIHLRAVKLGKLPYDEVQAELEAIVDCLQVLSERSPLPPETDHELIEKLVLEHYQKQVR